MFNFKRERTNLGVTTRWTGQLMIVFPNHSKFTCFRKDNWEMTKTHLTAYEEILKPIMETAQTQQELISARSSH